jgi:hypothetical protein
MARSFPSTFETISLAVIPGSVNFPRLKQRLQYSRLRLPSAFVPPPGASRFKGMPQLWQTSPFPPNILSSSRA